MTTKGEAICLGIALMVSPLLDKVPFSLTNIPSLPLR